MPEDEPISPPNVPRVAMRLDYANPPALLPPGAIVVPAGGAAPGYFPYICCNCMAPTRGRWRAEHGIEVPVCESCRIGWAVARLLAVLGAIFVTALVAWPLRHMAMELIGADRYESSYFPAMTMVAALAGFVAFRFAGGLRVAPARVGRAGLPPVTFVIFRNAEYQATARAWREEALLDIPK